MPARIRSVSVFILIFIVSGTVPLGSTLLEGDVYVQLITSLYSYAHANGTCSVLDAESAQNLEAVRWSYTLLNQKNVYPFKIDMQARIRSVSVFVLIFIVPGTVPLGSTLLDGDVYVQLITSLYSYAHANGTCSVLDAESAQNLEAVRWSYTLLNQKNVYPFKIGLRLSTTCRSVKRAEEIAYDLAMELGTNTSDVVAVIGPEYSSETEVVSRLLGSLPEQRRLLQVTYGATSAFLSDRNMYKNLYRTIPSDNIQVEVMYELMQRLDWTYVAIIYDADSYGKGGKDTLMAGIRSRDLCFPVQIAIDDNQRNTPNLKEILKTKILNATVPIGGIIVYGGYELIDKVLNAAEDIQISSPELTRPVFLFSETGTYVTDHRSRVALGSYVTSPPRRFVSEFLDDWKNKLLNLTTVYSDVKKLPWLPEFYQNTLGCQLADNIVNNNCSITSEDFKGKVTHSAYNQYAIQTALTLGKVIDQTVGSKCGNKFCREVLQLPRKAFLDTLQNLKVDFDDDFGNVRLDAFRNPDLILNFNGSVNPNLPKDFPLYEVYNVQRCADTAAGSCLKKIAEYPNNKKLTVTSETDIKDYDQTGTENTWPDVRKPQCPNGHTCPTCGEPSYIYPTLFVPGDLYIVGIVPVHLSGPTPMQCGDIKIGSIDVVESIRFAIEEAKTIYSGSVPGVDIGVIIIDSCNDAQTVQEKILTLHRLGVYHNGAYVMVADTIIGYIAAWSSDTSKAVAAVLSRLNFPQISYSSTAPILSTRSIYPYFMRICSPDTKQARVMMNVAKTLEADVIQIVYSAGAYGEGARDVLIELAKNMTICIAQTVEITKTSDQSTFLASLRKHSYARYVLIFVGSAELTRYMKTLNDINKDEFQFIASESWGGSDIVKGLTNLKGSITIATEIPINDKFVDHMKLLTPDGTNANPWIRPYMEKYFGCYYQWSYNKVSGNQCSGQEALDAHRFNYYIATWSSFAEKGVHVMLKGAKQAMDKYCNGSQIICPELKRNTADFVEMIQSQTLKEDNTEMRVMDNNGDGVAGYVINVVVLEATGNIQKIGSSENGAFNFQLDTFRKIRGVNIASVCAGEGACQLCFRSTQTIETTKISDAMIGLLVAFGFVCCLLAGIIIFICVRHGCCIRCDPEKRRLRYDGTYLTAIFKGPTHDEPAKERNYDVLPGHRVMGGSSAESLSAQTRMEGRNTNSSGDSGGEFHGKGREFSDGSSSSRDVSSGGRTFSDESLDSRSRGRGYVNEGQINFTGNNKWKDYQTGDRRPLNNEVGNFSDGLQSGMNMGCSFKDEGRNYSDGEQGGKSGGRGFSDEGWDVGKGRTDYMTGSRRTLDNEEGRYPSKEERDVINGSRGKEGFNNAGFDLETGREGTPALPCREHRNVKLGASGVAYQPDIHSKTGVANDNDVTDDEMFS